jgi:mRNA interferase RelE/StbE
VYKVLIKRQALKQLEKLPLEIILKINEAISKLSVNHKPKGCKKLNHPDGLFRIRVGNYRIIYLVKEQELIVETIKIAHRKNSYRNI